MQISGERQSQESSTARSARSYETRSQESQKTREGVSRDRSTIARSPVPPAGLSALNRGYSMPVHPEQRRSWPKFKCPERILPRLLCQERSATRELRTRSRRRTIHLHSAGEEQTISPYRNCRRAATDASSTRTARRTYVEPHRLRRERREPHNGAARRLRISYVCREMGIGGGPKG